MTDQSYANTANVFLIVDARGLSIPIPNQEKEGLTEDTAGALEALSLARQVSAKISDAQGRVSAFRVTDGKLNEADFLNEIQPSAIMRLYGSTVAYNAEKTKSKNVTTTNKEGKQETRAVESWKYGYRASLELELVSYPARESILKKTISANVDKSCNDCTQKPNSDLIEPLFDGILIRLATEVANAVRPVDKREIVRPVLYQEDSPLSKQAYEAAMKGKWVDARAAWKKRLEEDPKDWKAPLGLGVDAEREGRFDEARTWYERAKELAADSSEAKKIDFAAIIAAARIDHPLPPLGPATNTWFEKRLAVLPFSDEVVSLDGPDFLRKSVNDFLNVSGYQTMPLEEVDAILKDHGFSDGAQFIATTPEKIAGWLKADRIMFGHVENFDDKNIGIYRKRGVTAELKIWDAKKKDFVWMSRRRTKTKIFASNIGVEFFTGLLESWLERGSKVPLTAEVHRFTVLNLETLPLRYTDDVE